MLMLLLFEIFGRARNHGKSVSKIDSDLLQRNRPHFSVCTDPGDLAGTLTGVQRDI